MRYYQAENILLFLSHQREFVEGNTKFFGLTLFTELKRIQIPQECFAIIQNVLFMASWLNGQRLLTLNQCVTSAISANAATSVYADFC